MNKLKSTVMQAILAGWFGGIICVIKESLFDDENSNEVSFKKIAKTFGKGFAVGTALGGIDELFSYNGREKFKEQAFEEYYQQRRAAESQGRH